MTFKLLKCIVIFMTQIFSEVLCKPPFLAGVIVLLFLHSATIRTALY
ncbi:hypothetical protein VP511E551_P0026 [Vibrio phage 511E55-1]|nr:hypothetical protein VP511E551_P0026 [Vibrio phage 511E55-1]